jgi:uncharacterized protein (TIGR02145 family)
MYIFKLRSIMFYYKEVICIALITSFMQTLFCIKSNSTYTLNTYAKNGSIVIYPDEVEYRLGDIVTLTAEADSGYNLLLWSGDACGIDLTTTIIMNGNKNVTANFTMGTIGTVTDADGNIYRSLKIGNQIWTVENLRATKYNDGTSIPFSTSRASWPDTLPAFCYYNNTSDPISIHKNGALYNWYVVNTKKLAPTDWHVPSNTEWDTLQNYLITNGYNWNGTRTGNYVAKSMAATTDWKLSSFEGSIGYDLLMNNISGFSAIPSGFRFGGGDFSGLGENAGWWTATGWKTNDVRLPYPNISYSGIQLNHGSMYANYGLSIRLVKN